MSKCYRHVDYKVFKKKKFIKVSQTVFYLFLILISNTKTVTYTEVRSQSEDGYFGTVLNLLNSNLDQIQWLI